MLRVISELVELGDILLYRSVGGGDGVGGGGVGKLYEYN